jgi:poly-beta-1,6-N-acetyl-D-glucosamine N-deacetylase
MSKSPKSRWEKNRLRVTALAAVTLVGGGLYLVSPAGARRQIPGLGSVPIHWPTLGVEPSAPEEPAPPPFAPTALLAGTQAVPVLMYHDVVDQPSVYFDVSTAEFRQQLVQLKRSGANVIPLADLYDHLATGKDLPSRAVVLTFDDAYLGQFEKAYPLLKKFGYPATFFVHTGAVGVKTSRDHLTWEQIKALDKEGLISIECHTISHPEDLRKCNGKQLVRELTESKKVLEEKLGRRVRFLAYPVGNANSRVARVAREAGYDMAFKMGPGWVKAPADAFFVPRLLPRYLPEVCARLKTGKLALMRQCRMIDVKPLELESGSIEDGPVKMRWVRGGRVSGIRLMGRQVVAPLVQLAGATAGLNGTFFSDARVNSAGAGIVGPILSRFGPGFAPGLVGDRERLAGRPLVLISDEKMAFLPFQPYLALDEEGIQRLLPGARDCFMAGAWLVHRGRPLTREEMESFGLENVFDFRPRAFMGIDREGRAFLGATSTGNESNRVAETLAKLGLEECVLLDSGFSTSLVLGQEILVSGIMRLDMPARPVPHAFVMHAVDPETGKEVLTQEYLDPGEMGPPESPSFEHLEEVVGGSEAQAAISEPPARKKRSFRRRGYRRRR